MLDFDAFEERSAIMEFEAGMTRFDAETAAAREQGFQRHEVINANRKRHSPAARDHRAAPARKPADDLPGVQPAPQEEARPVPERNLSA